MLKISIITVNLNNAEGLIKTIQSVVCQNYKDIKYIIIDGGSTDKSISIIKEHENNISHWISEPDKGIYDAMNKGISFAQGEYVLFLNSGDYLYQNDVIEKIIDVNNHDFIYGNQLIESNGEIIKKWKPGEFRWFNMYDESLPHSSTLIRRSLFNEIGLYNLKYRIAADYDFFLHAYSLNKYSYKYVDIDFSVFNKEGVSSESENLSEILQERRQIIESHIPANLLDDLDLLKSYKQIETELGKYGLIWLINHKLLRSINRLIYRFLKRLNVIKSHRTFNNKPYA